MEFDDDDEERGDALNEISMKRKITNSNQSSRSSTSER